MAPLADREYTGANVPFTDIFAQISNARAILVEQEKPRRPVGAVKCSTPRTPSLDLGKFKCASQTGRCFDADVRASHPPTRQTRDSSENSRRQAWRPGPNDRAFATPPTAPPKQRRQRSPSQIKSSISALHYIVPAHRRLGSPKLRSRSSSQCSSRSPMIPTSRSPSPRSRTANGHARAASIERPAAATLQVDCTGGGDELEVCLSDRDVTLRRRSSGQHPPDTPSSAGRPIRSTISRPNSAGHTRQRHSAMTHVCPAGTTLTGTDPALQVAMARFVAPPKDAVASIKVGRPASAVRIRPGVRDLPRQCSS